MRALPIVATLVWLPTLLASTAPTASSQSSSSRAAQRVPALFETANRCQACHNGLSTPSGLDVSIGLDWRASMMAHSARDPYWQAAVRREMLDHPAAAAEIERECSRCHMPMAHVTDEAAGRQAKVFDHLPVGRVGGAMAALAADGVSCTVCHQIQKDKLGTPESYTGHFVVDTSSPADTRTIFGPFSIEPGLQRVMHSASTFQPSEAPHIQSSELCATCHTLYTTTLGADGKPIGSLPEQVPYLEWRHSAYRDTKSCQACHMPVVQEPVRVSSTLGEPRDDVSRHTFRGANFWMLRVLNRFRAELGVDTLPQELERAADDTLAHLERDTASIAIDRLVRGDDELAFEVTVRNRSGHKLPTAYPSRRAWLRVIVRDATGLSLFTSGAVEPSGIISGNDNDRDPSAFEPHHAEISRPEQVQIYENIMVDGAGVVTTGLLSGVRFVKDNRLLPDGFDKSTAAADIAVRGEASGDPDFEAGGDRLRYRIAVGAPGPLTIEASLLYQSVGYRWAQNLRLRPAPETDRFVRYYESMSQATVARLAHASVVAP
ncbi:MAG: hypothetical protein ACT4QD_21425 [Acidobacteriota bacterium]